MLRAGQAGEQRTCLSALDDDCVCREVDTPGKRGSAAQDLDVTIRKQLLHKVAVTTKHACMMDAKATLEQLPHLSIP